MAKKQENPIALFGQHLTQYSDKLAQWCPAGGNLSAESLVRFGIMAYSKEPKFHQPATWPSLRMALITAAQLGLEPSGPFGECYILPYWDSKAKCHLAQLQPGYRGLVKLMIQSGEIRRVRSQVVYANDEFDIHQGANPNIHHRIYTGEDRGTSLGAYSIAVFNDGELDFEWAAQSDIDKARNEKSPAWNLWPAEMARKFVIKRHSKQLPMSPVAQRAVMVDNAEGEGVSRVQEILDVDVVEVLPAATEAKEDTGGKLGEKLKSRMQTRKKKEEPAPKASEDPGEQTEQSEPTICSMCASPFEGEGDTCSGCRDETEWNEEG